MPTGEVVEAAKSAAEDVASGGAFDETQLNAALVAAAAAILKRHRAAGRERHGLCVHRKEAART